MEYALRDSEMKGGVLKLIEVCQYRYFFIYKHFCCRSFRIKIKLKAKLYSSLIVKKEQQTKITVPIYISIKARSVDFLFPLHQWG